MDNGVSCGDPRADAFWEIDISEFDDYGRPAFCPLIHSPITISIKKD